MGDPLLVDHRVYQDLHVLESQVYRWDVIFKKVSVGKFHGTVGMIDLGIVQLLDVRFSGTLFQYGYAPKDYVTFVLPAIDCQPFWWHFRRVDHNCLLSFPESRLVNAISGDGFHIYVLSIQKDRFLQLTEQLGIPQIQEQVGGREKVFTIDKSQVYPINSLLQALFLGVQAKQASVGSAKFIQTMKQKVPEMFLKLFVNAGDKEVFADRERDRTMARAIDYILAQDLKSISVNDIETAIGVKRRSLEYAFKEYFHVGPKSFIKALRLNQFRHELMVNGESVAKTALQYDFTHMGQLSKDYKLLFNELPSKTLRQAKEMLLSQDAV